MDTTTHGGNVYALAAAKGIGPMEVRDYSANINPLGLSPKGVKAMRARFEEIMHYPDPSVTGLIEAASSAYDVPTESILPGNGAAELLFALFRKRGLREVLVPSPGFSEYAEAARSADVKVRFYRLCERYSRTDCGFGMPYDTLRAEAAEDIEGRILVLGNPNNPDGSLLELGRMLPLIRTWAEKGGYVLSDESFIDFTDGATSLRPYLSEMPNLFVLHSLTKFFAVPGLRVGLLFGTRVSELRGFLPTWSVNGFAQMYATEALSDSEYISASKRLVRIRNEACFARYAGLPYFDVVKPSVNFMLMRRTGVGASLDMLKAYLAERCILVRDCRNYDGLEGDFIRIAIRSEEENDYLFEAIREFEESV